MSDIAKTNSKVRPLSALRRQHLEWMRASEPVALFMIGMTSMTVAMVVATLAGSAAAQEPEGKTWLDMTCAVTMQSAPDTSFIVSKVDGSYRNACTIADWPISSPAAAMECEDGAKATMELQGNDVLLDGLPVGTGMSDVPNRVSLIPKGDARLSCDR